LRAVHRGVRDRAHAQRDVGPFFDEVDHSVIENYLHLEVGMQGEELARWKFACQQSPLAACPQEVKDGVEDGTKVGGARSPDWSRRRQNGAQ